MRYSTGLALLLPFYCITRIGFMSALKSNLGISSLDVFNFGFSVRFCQYVPRATKKWHITLHSEDWLMDLIWFLFDVLPHLDIFHLQPGSIADRTSKQTFQCIWRIYICGEYSNLSTSRAWYMHVYTGKYFLGFTPFKGLGREDNKRLSCFRITWSRDRRFFQFQPKFHTM